MSLATYARIDTRIVASQAVIFWKRDEEEN
jgi:hypothetical protein